jgi:hypothetical protein
LLLLLMLLLLLLLLFSLSLSLSPSLLSILRAASCPRSLAPLPAGRADGGDV